jgi:hypothetical protein
MSAPYTAANLAHAFSQAFQRVLRQQPRQTLPTEVILDGTTLFLGGLVCDMARASHLTPQQRSELLETITGNLILAVEVADHQWQGR